MKNIPRIKLSFLEILLISLLIIIFVISFNTILVTGENSVIIVYIISFSSFIFMLGYILKFGIPKNDIKYTLLMFIIFISFILIYSFITRDVDGMKMVTRLIVLFSVFFLFGFSKWDDLNIITLAFMFSLFTIIFFMQWLVSYRTFPFTGIFLNSNILGIFMYITLYFHIIAWNIERKIILKLIWTIIIFMDLILVLVSAARSIWLSLVMVLLIFFFYDSITSKKIIYRLCFFLIIMILLLFSYIYPNLYTTEIGWKINDFVFNFTGKNFFSGRQELWIDLFYYISKKPLLGYGVSIFPSDLMHTELSSHNMYIQILLQIGIVGLFLFILLLFFIWECFYLKNGNAKNKLSLAFFTGLIVYQTFEMTIIQGSYAINLLQWILISIGIGFKIDSLNNERVAKRVIDV